MADPSSELDVALWSPGHERDAQAVARAVAEDDLEAALLALEGSDEAARQACRDRLAEWSEAVFRAGGTLEELRAVLIGEGIVGDNQSYYAVDNSMLSRVVHRRRGMPILVAAVWALVGKRAGLRCHGIGLPGHFIVAVNGQYVDAFARGRTLTRDEAIEIAKGFAPDVPFDEAWLKPVTTARWVQRVLANLAGSWYRAKSVVDHYRARRTARVVADSASTWLAEAYAALLLGLPELARDAWNTVVERWPKSPEAADAVRRLAALAGDDRTLN